MQSPEAQVWFLCLKTSWPMGVEGCELKEGHGGEKVLGQDLLGFCRPLQFFGFFFFFFFFFLRWQVTG